MGGCVSQLLVGFVAFLGELIGDILGRSRGLLSRSSLLGSLLCSLGLLRCILFSLFSLGLLRRQILGSLVELVGISLSLL